MGMLEDEKRDDVPPVRARKDQDDLAATLDGLFRETSRILAGRPEQAAELRALAGYVTEIRHLLFVLSDLPRSQGPAPSPGECRVLGRRFLELEGLVKELRNDLAAL